MKHYCAHCHEQYGRVRRGQVYCSDACRKRAFSDSLASQGIQGGIRTPIAVAVDSNDATPTNLIFDHPWWKEIGPHGFVKCVICREETHQYPVVLETDDPGIYQVVPVYHSDCMKVYV